MAVTDADKRKFTRDITKLREQNDCTFIEAIAHYCALKNIDPAKATSITKLINSSLKAKITAEARGLNLIKRKPRKSK